MVDACQCVSLLSCALISYNTGNLRRCHHVEEASLKSGLTSSPHVATQRITRDLEWNLNRQKESSRILASPLHQKLPKQVKIILNDNYNSVVSSHLLVANSEYFFRCLDGNWQEITKQEIVLDFSMVPWSIFYKWMETGSLSLLPPYHPVTKPFCYSPPPFSIGLDTDCAVDDFMVPIVHLTNAWILGDYLIAPQFQNHVIDELTCVYSNMWYRKWHIPWSHIKDTCERSLPSSPLHKMMLDFILFLASITHITLDKDVLCLFEEAGFIASQLTLHSEMPKGLRRPAPWNRHPKFYHVAPRDVISVPWHLKSMYC